MKILTNKVRFLCVVIYLSHFVISHHILPAYNRANVFPFFDWNLFAYNSVYQQIFLIRVHSINGQKLEKPQLVSHNKNLFPGQDAFQIPHQVLRVGEIYQREKESREFFKAKMEMENNIFANFESVKYDFLNAKVHIRKILKSDHLESFETIYTSQYLKRGARR